MLTLQLEIALLESLHTPIVFVDTEHVIRYMNAAAERHHKRSREELVGRSVFDCHKPGSNAKLLEVFTAMQQGEDERMISENSRRRIFMRAVRDANGTLVGYYERFEYPGK